MAAELKTSSPLGLEVVVCTCASQVCKSSLQINHQRNFDSTSTTPLGEITIDFHEFSNLISSTHMQKVKDFQVCLQKLRSLNASSRGGKSKLFNPKKAKQQPTPF